MSTDMRETPEEILEGKIDRLQRRREWRRFLMECVVLAVAVYAVFHYVIGIAFVSGRSMEPSLFDGDLVVFYRLDQEYQKNDTVIIHREGNLEYIKRIAAVPGEEVTLDEEGALVTGDGQEEGSLASGRTLPVSEEITYPYEVPEDSYFVLGDNRENSQDSRSFGAVKRNEITGRVFFRLGLTK